MRLNERRYATLKRMIDRGEIEIIGRIEYDGDDCEVSETISSDHIDVLLDQNESKK